MVVAIASLLAILDLFIWSISLRFRACVRVFIARGSGDLIRVRVKVLIADGSGCHVFVGAPQIH